MAGLDETALGQTIADAAANALNRFLTGEYLKNIYIGFNQMSAQMLEMVDGTAQLADGANQLSDGAYQSADGAFALSEGLNLATAGSPQLRSGADMFERRLLRPHPNLRSRRHGKLIDVLRQKKDGVVKK